MIARAALAVVAVLTGCAAATPSTAPSQASSDAAGPSPSADPPPPLTLGAGFRYSTYGIGPIDPGPEYWRRVGEEMAARFDGAKPGAVWIVGEIAGQGTVLTFPGTSDEPTIHFRPEDNNEAALDLFDEAGFDVWLQVEPANAPIDQLIDIILDRYGHHPSVVGVGIDVEWLGASGSPEGRPVTDAEAREWVAAVRAHDPGYRLFLKHWERDVMPPTERDGIVFIDDSQGFADLEAMVAEFAVWGEHFAPSQVGFQFGYLGDRPWWGGLADPPSDIGAALLDAVPNVAGLYWVDFTVREIFEPAE
ncbi:MAG TPA: hypothetical protein VI277_00640 [Candidatus Limnocylindria bacterium]